MKTAVLFLLGKSPIGYYLGNSNVGTTNGAAVSMVIILLWVYYSLFFYHTFFGAEFTKMYDYIKCRKLKFNSLDVISK